MVIIASFLFFNDKIEIFQTHDTKMKNQISQVVTDCIYDSASRGAFLLGFQAGYITIPPQIEANPFSYTNFGFKIPNWDTQRGNIPTIESMQNELNQFIADESYSCIQNNLKTLEETFDITIDDKFYIETRINDQNIAIDAKLLITFNEKNSPEILTVEDYYVKLDSLRLGDLYTLAAQIYNLEANNNLLEDLTLDQIQTANDYSSEYSMPSEGMSISCGKRVWTIPQLKRNLANMNNNNFKYLQFVGTYPKTAIFDANLNNESANLRDYFEKQYVFNLQNPKKSYVNYNVEIMMPSTEITGREGIIQRYPYRTFEVTPSSGQIVESIDMDIDLGAKIPIPCIQIYHHLYTLDYDLIVKLTDYNEDGQLYTFQFPLRVKINKNTPKEEPTSFIPTEKQTLNQQSYCAPESKQYPLMVTVKDNQDNPLDNVNISYKCLNLKCDIGQTTKPTFMEVERKYAPSELVAEFPFCIGGKVIAEKEGYHTAKQRVNTDQSLLRRETFFGDSLVELTMITKKSFNINEETFLMKSKETGLGKRVLTENDGSIYITIENLEYEFESTAIWPNEKNFLDKIEFLNEENIQYNLSILYMDGEYNLKGMFEIQNWQPNIHKGNRLQFIIPSTDNIIEEDNYVSFYEYIQKKSSEENYQPKFY